MDLNNLSFNSSRRFGVEIELNSSDNRDFQEFPLASGELPEGIYDIANMITNHLGEKTLVKGWHSTHHNDGWVLKPDRSCGIEVCSPVSKGWEGIKSICNVVDLFEKTPQILADGRCSLHVHVDVSDCATEEVAKILYWWIKCESVFLDSVPFSRKKNRYCQCIGMTDLFEHDAQFDSYSVLKKLGSQKYYTANCYHYLKNERRTIEFRIIEGAGCKNSFLVKNWLKLILHFVEMAIKAPYPMNYNYNNPNSGFCWLDLQDVMKFLGFSGEYNLSKGLLQVRDWFLLRIQQNTSIKDVNSFPGIWSEAARKISKLQLNEILEKCNILDQTQIVDRNELLYSEEYKY